MSVKQFEEFLVTHFLQWSGDNVAAGFRYQFQSPNVESSLNLYRSFVNQESIAGLIDAKGSKLAFIKCGDVKLIPVIHRHGTDLGYTENFISFLRDEVSAQQGAFADTALFIIHNSLLDTIINSADDLTSEGSVFDPSNIKASLENLIDESDAPIGKEVSSILLEYQYDLITEDKGSMFGFEDLYEAISDGNIRFSEINLLDDPAILSMDGQSEQIRKRLDKNRALYDDIVDVIEHYPEQLEEHLPDFSETFINKYFDPNEPDAWKRVTFDEFRKEQEKNREQNLVIVEESSDTGKLTVRSKGEGKTAQKERHVLLVVDEGRDDFDFLITFDGGKINNSEIIVRDKCKEINFKDSIILKGGSRNTDLLVKGQVRNKPRFFTVSLNRIKTSEKFKFKCLVVNKGQFNTEAIENSFLINPSKQLVTLQTQEMSLDVSLNGATDRTVNLDKIGQCFNVSDQDVIDFESISNEVDRIVFDVLNADAKLTFDIEGAAPTDTLVLPLMFDQTRAARLFTNSLIGIYNRSKRRV